MALPRQEFPERRGMNISITLVFQLGILASCGLVVAHWLARFPNPSLLVGPSLPLQKRWPQPELWKRIEEGSPDPGFIRLFPAGPGAYATYGGRTGFPGRRHGASERGAKQATVPCHRPQRLGRPRREESLCVARVKKMADAGDMLESGRDDPLRDDPYCFLRDKRSPRQRRRPDEDSLSSPRGVA